MNIFVYELATGTVDPTPQITPRKAVVEDNVGEGIHIHLRNLRIELSIEDFDGFVDNLKEAREEIANGDR